jgi:ligand-binding sensor domain-containing protein
VKEGLSQGNVWSVHQDKFGFTWIATEDGLNLYDGYTCTIFRNSPGDSTSISNNYTRCIAEDKEGNIWIGTREGLNMYDRKMNRFNRFPDLTDKDSPANSFIFSLFVDSKDNLCIGTAQSLSVYNLQTKKYKQHFHDPANPASLPLGAVRSITEDNLHQLWIATMGGLSKYNAAEVSFTNYYHDVENPKSISSNQVSALYADNANNLWVGTFDGGLNKMNIGKEIFTRYPHNPDNSKDPASVASHYIYSISGDKQGNIWLATDKGLNLMDGANATFTHYTRSADDESSIRSNNVTHIFFDINDRMWVSTRFGGVNIYDKGQHKFLHFKQSSAGLNSVSGNNITSFTEDEKGNFWIAVDGDGLNYYDRATGLFTTLLNQPTDPNSLSNNKVLSVKIARSGGMWIGYWNGGVDYYDRKTKKFKHYKNDPENPQSLSHNSILNIFVDSKDNVWVATWGNGLNKYDPAIDGFKRYTHDPNDPKTLRSSLITYLAEDHLGRIWLGTEQEGVIAFDPETETFTNYKQTGGKGDISANGVNVIFEDSKKRLWVGTTFGLNLFDWNTQTFKGYHMNDGLPNETILGILEDDKGNLWLSTNKGLSKFQPEAVSFTNYDELDGLQDYQFNRWAFLRLSSGELLFGGINGFNLLNPNTIYSNKYKPPVYITDFKLFNKSVSIDGDVLQQNIMLTQEINLRYKENFISFEFAALNYLQPEKNQYKYMLEGLQTEWVDAGSDRRAAYTNLSPGEYTFRVSASNNDGVWSDKMASVKITIVPPFWQTWWFISALVIIGVYSIIYYLKYQKRKVRSEQEKLNAIIEERTREITLQTAEIVKKAEQEKIYHWITQGLAMISDTVSKNSGDLNALSNTTLKTIIKYVGAHQGLIAIGMKDDDEEEHLQVFGTYGISIKDNDTERIKVGEGLLGETYKDGELKVLHELPEGYLKIESGLGAASPAKVVLQPLKTEDGEVVGVMELAFLSDVPDTVHEFLNKVSSLIALNVVAVTLTHKTMLLLQQSKEQTEEMRAQEEEMRQNMEELEATQEEFRRREEEYSKKIEESDKKIQELEQMVKGKA